MKLNKNRKSSKYKKTYVGMGLALGIIFGAAYKHLVLGIIIGVGLGLVLEYKNKNKEK